MHTLRYQDIRLYQVYKEPLVKQDSVTKELYRPRIGLVERLGQLILPKYPTYAKVRVLDSSDALVQILPNFDPYGKAGDFHISFIHGHYLVECVIPPEPFSSLLMTPLTQQEKVYLRMSGSHIDTVKIVR